MKIEYTDVAIDDMARLREFIAEHNPLAADKIARRLVAGIKQLSRQPRLGHPVSHAPDPDQLRDLVPGSYIVRYTPLRQSVLILRIWHHREDWSNDDITEG
ncbi:MAG TPA: type II toxin-antitoxin system RelE/ParE family toxin [Sedimenticola sp.]|nr:type II toxin-antitoxin system RelE/ParE family toxin [Sedimenticola sp.]